MSHLAVDDRPRNSRETPAGEAAHNCVFRVDFKPIARGTNTDKLQIFKMVRVDLGRRVHPYVDASDDHVAYSVLVGSACGNWLRTARRSAVRISQ